LEIVEIAGSGTKDRDTRGPSVEAVLELGVVGKGRK
jgi:hypothetical protein